MYAVILTLMVGGAVLEQRISTISFDTHRACLEYVASTEALRSLLRLRLEQQHRVPAKVLATCTDLSSVEA